MNYLLDTCALIWLVNNAVELGPRARQACLAPSSGIMVSVASAWEIALKQARGKLALSQPVAQWWNHALQRYSLTEVPISASIAMASVALPPIHADPADRLLAATALEHQLT